MTTAWIAKNRTTLVITVVVLVAAYVFYYAKNGIAPSMYTSAWGYAIPLVLAALVGVIGERSGVVNIGIEGQMLVAAFVGFFAAAFLVGVLRTGAPGLQFATGIAPEIVDLLLAIILLMVSIPVLGKWIFRSRADKVTAASTSWGN